MDQINTLIIIFRVIIKSPTVLYRYLCDLISLSLPVLFLNSLFCWEDSTSSGVGYINFPQGASHVLASGSVSKVPSPDEFLLTLDGLGLGGPKDQGPDSRD